jgi:hypothetical protein
MQVAGDPCKWSHAADAMQSCMRRMRCVPKHKIVSEWTFEVSEKAFIR